MSLDTTTYVLIGVTAILTATYGLLRFVEVFNAPGLSVRYFVRSVNITFMVIILMGEFFYQEMMGQILLIMALAGHRVQSRIHIRRVHW